MSRHYGSLTILIGRVTFVRGCFWPRTLTSVLHVSDLSVLYTRLFCTSTNTSLLFLSLYLPTLPFQLSFQLCSFPNFFFFNLFWKDPQTKDSLSQCLVFKIPPQILLLLLLRGPPPAGCRTRRPAASTRSRRRAAWTEIPTLRRTAPGRGAPSACQREPSLEPDQPLSLHFKSTSDRFYSSLRSLLPFMFKHILHFLTQQLLEGASLCDLWPSLMKMNPQTWIQLQEESHSHRNSTEANPDL